MGTPWRVTGLENLSPARKTLALAVGAAGFVLLGIGIFTELPYSWLFTVVLIVLPLIFQNEKDEKDEYSETETDHNKEL